MGHGILDDLEAVGAPMGFTTYSPLFAAYYKENMFREAKSLLKQIRKAYLVLNLSDEMLIFRSKSDLAEFLVPIVCEFNSSIYFFCKARMVVDAFKTYRRMQEMKIQPTQQTFSNLVHGYSSLGMLVFQ
jgi:pentatricopeptide repeat protein